MMVTMQDLSTPVKNTWCPGCGNFGILTAVKRAIIQLGLEREKVAIVTGIGCHGKITNYLNVNGIHVIHGRVLPVATAIKLANKEQTANLTRLLWNIMRIALRSRSAVPWIFPEVSLPFLYKTHAVPTVGSGPDSTLSCFLFYHAAGIPGIICQIG